MIEQRLSFSGGGSAVVNVGEREGVAMLLSPEGPTIWGFPGGSEAPVARGRHELCRYKPCSREGLKASRGDSIEVEEIGSLRAWRTLII